jgi:hypothetical protein
MLERIAIAAADVVGHVICALIGAPALATAMYSLDLALPLDCMRLHRSCRGLDYQSASPRIRWQQLELSLPSGPIVCHFKSLAEIIVPNNARRPRRGLRSVRQRNGQDGVIRSVHHNHAEQREFFRPNYSLAQAPRCPLSIRIPDRISTALLAHLSAKSVRKAEATPRTGGAENAAAFVQGA